MNSWIAHVKKYKDDHSITYKEALKLAGASYKPAPKVPKQQGKGLKRAGKSGCDC